MVLEIDIQPQMQTYHLSNAAFGMYFLHHALLQDYSGYYLTTIGTVTLFNVFAPILMDLRQVAVFNQCTWNALYFLCPTFPGTRWLLFGYSLFHHDLVSYQVQVYMYAFRMIWTLWTARIFEFVEVLEVTLWAFTFPKQIPEKHRFPKSIPSVYDPVKPVLRRMAYTEEWQVPYFARKNASL